YLARDNQMPTCSILVKVLKTQATADRQKWLEDHFYRQAKALARVKHPGIVQNLDIGFTATGQPFLVMNRIIGTDLRSQIISGKGLIGGNIRFAEIIRQLGSAVSDAHDCG